MSKDEILQFLCQLDPVFVSDIFCELIQDMS